MKLGPRPASSKRPDSRFHRVLFKLSRSLPLAGFHARAFLPDAEDRIRITALLAAAIQLLSRHAPTRLAALQRDLPRILVGPTHHLAQCIYGSSMCLLQFEYVAGFYETLNTKHATLTCAMHCPVRLAVLLSGSGSTLQNLIDRIGAGRREIDTGPRLGPAPVRNFEERAWSAESENAVRLT